MVSDAVLLALIATISPTIAAAAAVIISLRNKTEVTKVKTDLELSKVRRVRKADLDRAEERERRKADAERAGEERRHADDR